MLRSGAAERVLGGMAAGVDGLELLDADLGVNGGGFQLLVAQKLLDETDVRPSFEQVDGRCVPHQMTASGAADVGGLEPFGNLTAQHIGVEGLAVTGQKEVRLLGVQQQARAHLVEIAGEPFQRAAADGYHAVLVTLALADVERLALAVQVGDMKAGQLAAADAGGIEGFQNGAVAEAEGITDVGDGEDGAGFAEAERLLGKVLFLAWQFKFRGRVGNEEVLFGEPGEEALEGAKAGTLGADPERIAVFLAPVPEVALVAFEDGLGDRGGKRQLALDGPEQELLCCPRPGNTGSGRSWRSI